MVTMGRQVYTYIFGTFSCMSIDKYSIHYLLNSTISNIGIHLAPHSDADFIVIMN